MNEYVFVDLAVELLQDGMILHKFDSHEDIGFESNCLMSCSEISFMLFVEYYYFGSPVGSCTETSVSTIVKTTIALMMAVRAVRFVENFSVYGISCRELDNVSMKCSWTKACI